ncbi:MAG: trypsin-like peptidase domain-containing protein [Candidatus Dadabacteria bacterium]|nr:trypsin-like peptidase domain-containing protein [Candidatus Dadabacteria bacterium]
MKYGAEQLHFRKGLELLIEFAASTFILASLFIPSSHALAVQNVKEAIVKIYTIRNKPNYYNPWTMTGPSSSTGSGSIIEGKRIITNAHVVSNQTFVQVRRYGEFKRYQAKVLNVSHEVDLAILTVEDKGFFDGVRPLKFGRLPLPQDEVLVYGFPLGGDTLSITKGVMSRIEHQMYAHSGGHFLAGQLDAAINPGNSGGPVMVKNRIVGVVMQTITKAENIGYMVPTPIISHFLEDIKDGRYDGFPSIGVVFQGMENEDLKLKYSMGEKSTGVLVIKVLKDSPSDGRLRAGDILVSVDGHKIGDDGTVEFRPKERTSMSYYIQARQIGEKLKLGVFRDGKEKVLTLELSRPMQKDMLVPFEHYDSMPSYYIYGGLVFSPLSKNYLKTWGHNWYNAAPKELVALLRTNLPSTQGEQVVLIVKVLAADVNKGYHNVTNWIISEVNGKKIWNLKELIEAVEGGVKDTYVEFKSIRGATIVLDNKKVNKSHDRILRTYRIKEGRSGDLAPH